MLCVMSLILNRIGLLKEERENKIREPEKNQREKRWQHPKPPRNCDNVLQNVDANYESSIRPMMCINLHPL